MKGLGVLGFVLGVAALALLVLRRGNATPATASDSIIMFIGLASAIAGFGLFFVYAVQ